MSEEKDTKIFGLKLKEWIFVAGFLGLTGNQVFDQFTNSEKLDSKVDQSSVQVQLDSLKAQIGRQITHEAMDAVINKELSDITGRDAQFIRHALDGVEAGNKDHAIWDSIYKPYLDKQMRAWDGICGLGRTRKNIEGNKVREYAACGVGWVSCFFSHPAGRENVRGEWWWYTDPITGNVIVLDDWPRIPLI